VVSNPHDILDDALRIIGRWPSRCHLPHSSQRSWLRSKDLVEVIPKTDLADAGYRKRPQCRSSKALLREPSIESDIMCDDQNDRAPEESWTRQSILLFRFITRQQCQCSFSEHHYVDGPTSTIYFDNESLTQRFDIRTTGHSERHTKRYFHLPHYQCPHVHQRARHQANYTKMI